MSAPHADGARHAPPYRPQALEPRWQSAWRDARLFDADPQPGRPKWFIVELPPFATGQLHMGHARNYVLADADARFRRMQGYNVLYTTGFDTFGLPTELAAREAGCAPERLARECSEAMAAQFVRLGLGHDSRRITQYHVPAYYRWVQWVFLRLFEAGHCFRRDAPVAWCPQCEVTLAASLVDDGRCWRCKRVVSTVVQPQWFVRESTFADEMLDGLDRLAGWPDEVKKIHRDWIGRREGLRLRLPVRGRAHGLALHLDDAGWLPGVRFVAVGRRHPLAAAALRDGVQPGETILLADVAQAAGAAGAVELPIIVEDAPGDAARAGRPDAVAADRALAERHALAAPSPGAGGAPAVCDLDAMLAAGQAERVVGYRLQDWNIARNRYWGPPVPIVHCAACGPVAVPEHALPVRLPEDVDLSRPGNPLEHHARFRDVRCPRCGASARRDAQTLEAYSSPWWYHWMCKRVDVDDPFNRDDANAWLPVDLMIGGADQVRTCFFHVRMIARALRGMGIADVDEPVTTLLALGMVKQDDRKMSKSAGNAVSLASIIERYGADALRLAIIGAAAPENDVNWSDDLVRRQRAFVARLWAFVHRVAETEAGIAAAHDAGDPPAAGRPDALHRRMQDWLATGGRRIAADFRRHDYHLALKNLAFLFERLQAFDAAMRRRAPPRAEDVAILAGATRQLVLFLGPFAPHVAEELWQALGGAGLVAGAAWPGADVVRSSAATAKREAFA
ncbi:leucine--tRNA ligase [Burkholderia pseudomallei]|uniref:class I tRNA ligase family protein n=1 Tax=Burkholderia pseudomallei TaxID=28450 RepID=UPI0005321E58|nr:class I tRNA ligase family protein [Burkholderia pseudomallei]KGS22379.1 tRNA synthetases class I family protein [Burkholderia pseudomallei MSHR4378]MBO3050030.1 class I tRNA ligase family protein [Burkholderia pseudomallei]ONC37797.1 leucine--tRNA ligase [Burkholderia pseudomallei]